VVATLKSILASKSTGDRFWTDSASNLVYQASVLAKASGAWSLSGIASIACTESARQAALKALETLPDVSDYGPVDAGQIRSAIAFWQEEWPALEDKTRSGILATARSWFGVLTQHPDLLRWSEAEPKDESAGLNLLDVLQGGRLALHIPAYRYGQAGALVSALLKSRLYAALKQRADQPDVAHQPLIFMIDEAQEIATDEDATLLAIGRSLGLATIAATQTVEGVTEKLGEEVADKWLGIYGNVITLPNRSGMSDQFVAERVGLTWKSLVGGTMGMAIRDAIRADVMTSDRSAAALQSSLTYTDGDLMSQFQRGTRGVMTTLAAALGQGTAQSPFSTQIGVLPTVFAGEMTTLLAEPNTALAVLTRARVPRRDVIRVQPVYHVPKIEPVKDFIDVGTSIVPAGESERHLVGLITLPPQLQNWLLTGE
jgi:hypothetical protein